MFGNYMKICIRMPNKLFSEELNILIIIKPTGSYKKLRSLQIADFMK